MPESDIDDRIQRLETQTTRLKAVVLLLAVQILWSGGIKDAMAQFRARMKPAAIVGKRPARGTLEYQKSRHGRQTNQQRHLKDHGPSRPAYWIWFRLGASRL